MKEFKGTNGKWMVAGYDDLKVVSDMQNNEHIGYIAHCGDGTRWGNDCEVAKANAQLIAAAPEILKELIEFCKTFESTIGYQGYDHNTFVALNDRYIKSKKAIKKALGL